MKHAREDYNDLLALDARIPEEEPVFLLRGCDIVAPKVVRFWAEMNNSIGGDVELSRLARIQADRMEEWPNRGPADLSDPASHPAKDHIHFSDPRYQQWLKCYTVLLMALPPVFREMMRPSIGTLTSTLINVLFPVAEREPAPPSSR